MDYFAALREIYSLDFDLLSGLIDLVGCFVFPRLRKEVNKIDLGRD